MAAKGRGRYTLQVPLDASQVEEGEDQELRVVAVGRGGSLTAATVSLDRARQGSVALSFDEQPGPVRVLVGPARATNEELVASQTISVDVPGHRWGQASELKLEPIRIAPYFWFWWWRWCREYVIRGRVVCPDGSPVPGAEVCAFDVDWWFWWSSSQQVGCDTSDVNGAFEIRFRWCCGFWPWWWWRHRIWEIDPFLVERVRGVIERDPKLRLARTEAQPSLGVFSEVLASDGVATGRPLMTVEGDRLEQIRRTLLERLPVAPELEALHVWPWWPWRPWWDCTPDIIFRVTQDCHERGKVIVDEGTAQTRWNIPNPLDVVLVADDDACCRRICPDPPCVEGECLNIAQVCFASIDEVGGNAGAPGPDGYLYPGAVAPGVAAANGDRPFAGVVPVYKANIMTGVDFYEVEYDSGAGFGPLPPGAAISFCRHWVQPPHPPAQPAWQHGDVAFNFNVIAGHSVVESREHYEASTGLPLDAFWTVNEDLVVPLDSSKFPDGTYRFRVVGWQDGGGGTLVDRRVLPVCGTQIDNGWVLTFDNRLDPDPAHPTSPDHDCGAGTVHLCVTEPDTDFIDVRVNGVSVAACDTVELQKGVLEIDFLAHDPDGHLAFYSLGATYGENQINNLLSLPSATLSVLAGDFEGPTYGEALGQGAPAPTWRGGRLRLTVDLAEAFPIPCCYQLELRAWKRTVVGSASGACGYSCDASFGHWNLSEYTIGVGVCGPRD